MGIQWADTDATGGITHPTPESISTAENVNIVYVVAIICTKERVFHQNKSGFH